jgi:hypothetical protein
MPISWNEIRNNAIGFAHEWTGARSEAAEKQTFWNAFFDVFGMRRRTVATFEEPVKRVGRATCSSRNDYASLDCACNNSCTPTVLCLEYKAYQPKHCYPRRCCDRGV